MGPAMCGLWRWGSGDGQRAPTAEVVGRWTTPTRSSTPLSCRTARSLLRPSMFAIGWWISIVAGLTLVGYALLETVPALGEADDAFWVIAGLLLLFEFSPVIVGSGYDSQGVATSDAFTFAILYLYGPWPAIALLAAATLVSELIKKKPPWRMFWNIGQFGLSLGSAALIMVLWKVSSG